MAKSNEAIVWALFAGGGTLAAFITPVMVLITGLLIPFGLLSEDTLAYDKMLAMARNPIGKLLLFIVVFLPLWHAAHRVNASLHELGIRRGRRIVMLLCYGTPVLAGIIAAAYLFGI